MHILKIIHGYPPLYNAGSEVYSQSVCNEFSKEHKVSVFTREENLYARDNGQSTAALKKKAALSKSPISFRGEYMNDELVDKVFRNVDCIVVPSIWAENSPLVIHEAQECGIPVFDKSELVEVRANSN